MIGITLLGSTGSIGLSTLDVVERHPERFRIVALTANQDAEGVARQCRQHRPEYAVMADPVAAGRLRLLLSGMSNPPEVLAGPRALESVAALGQVDAVMAAIVGAAGLLPTLAAARAGKRLLLANKEALVVAGSLLVQAAADSGARILPIDSEHNAVYQCLPEGFERRGLEQLGVERIVLTASGGPFLDLPLEQLASVTPEQACSHPNWDMGRKISVDSATMMNKGLELIEACWLFGTNPGRIDILVHPQSLVHSLVQYRDGSLLAQLGNPDMRIPIAHALCWPERMESGVAPLDLVAIQGLDFRPLQGARFPCLDLAYEAADRGGTAPVILNAANEVAVAAFLQGRIGFTRIAAVVAETLQRLPAQGVLGWDVEQLLDVDQEARRVAEQNLPRSVG